MRQVCEIYCPVIYEVNTRNMAKRLKKQLMIRT